MMDEAVLLCQCLNGALRIVVGCRGAKSNGNAHDTIVVGCPFRLVPRWRLGAGGTVGGGSFCERFGP